MVETEWLTEWIRISQERAHVGEDPFDISAEFDTYSAFALKGQPLPSDFSLRFAEGFVDSLIKIQTAQRPSLSFSRGANYSDLSRKHVNLDGSIITECPYRPVPTIPPRESPEISPSGSVPVHTTVKTVLESSATSRLTAMVPSHRSALSTAKRVSSSR